MTLSISGGIQSAADTLTDRITFERNVETERIDVSYPDNAGVLIDIGGRVRLWKQLGIGVAVGHSVAEGTADISASIPHPFLFTQPRTVTGKQGGLSREETAVHVQVQYTIPASRRVRIVLGGGPSRIKLTQDVVTDVNVIEAYPYDTATFDRAVTRGSTASVIGVNVGADVAWNMTRTVGFGGLVRYSRADVELDVRSGHTVSAKAGGAQAAGGLRISF